MRYKGASENPDKATNGQTQKTEGPIAFAFYALYSILLRRSNNESNTNDYAETVTVMNENIIHMKQKTEGDNEYRHNIYDITMHNILYYK